MNRLHFLRSYIYVEVTIVVFFCVTKNKIMSSSSLNTKITTEWYILKFCISIHFKNWFFW